MTYGMACTYTERAMELGCRIGPPTLDTSDHRCEIAPTMWSAYSARQSADLVGMTESAVRGLVRGGVIGNRSDELPTRLAFSDLTFLRAVKRWQDQGISLRSIRRQLGALRNRLDSQRGSHCPQLASLSISAHHGYLVVTDELGSYRADNGQLLLPFDWFNDGIESGDTKDRSPDKERNPNVGASITRLPDRASREAAAREAAHQQDASEWFERALELEELDTDEAIIAYTKVLDLRPESIETLINLGRLHAESGSIREATEYFERALEINPNDATTNYNLGVVAQDAGNDHKALDLYRRALEHDPSLAEAHYNLATIYDRTGDPRAAIRHINAYRKLLRE